MRSSGLPCGGHAVDFQTLQRLKEGHSPDIAPAAEPVDPFADFSVLHKAALLTMHESAVKRALVARLLIDSQERPLMPEYRFLVAQGLAHRRLNDKWHHLTPRGVTLAKELEKTLCQEFNIHLLLRGGDVGWQTVFRCPCGWSTRVRRSPTAPGNANYAYQRHLARAQGFAAIAAEIESVS